MADPKPKNGNLMLVRILLGAVVGLLLTLIVGLGSFNLSHTQAPYHPAAGVKMKQYDKDIAEVKGDVKVILGDVTRIKVLVEQSHR